MTLSREETPARQRVSRDRRLKCQRGDHKAQLLSPHSNASDEGGLRNYYRMVGRCCAGEVGAQRKGAGHGCAEGRRCGGCGNAAYAAGAAATAKASVSEAEDAPLLGAAVDELELDDETVAEAIAALDGGDRAPGCGDEADEDAGDHRGASQEV